MQETFLSWQTKEYEKKQKSRRWYLIAVVLLSIIVLYALFTNNPVMAVTFILIGVVGYLFLEKDPDDTLFAITSDGISADNELYEYENIHSFWIFYESDGLQAISLHVQSAMMPFVKIPLGDQDPVKVRELLVQYIPEKKHKQNFIDIMENFF